jgi:beta-galactosidase
MMEKTMAARVPPVAPTFPHMLHGGDYNPEQWIRTPEVWDEDIRLMKAAGCNSVTLGVFSWVMLEPAEGQFTFDWLDTVMEKVRAGGLQVILATPGGAKPAWLAKKYPETLRVDNAGRRLLWGGRHNHCPTSPIYRKKCQTINRKLAERYGHQPNLILWHVNNEYSGDCHCPLCAAAFRDWLKTRYGGDLDRLNLAWWSTFWSHAITDWEQIDPPGPLGETQVHGQNLDWQRFVTAQTVECFKAESAPLRDLSPRVPITTNLMMFYSGLDYYKLAQAGDVVSWDSYPSYHDRKDDWIEAVRVSFVHNQRRAMKKKPFLLMECSPGVQNYKPVNKLKRPGLHAVEAMQAVAHGSDSVLYFQWRKSRGGIEKFHGAVVDHFPTPEARMFREVSDLGKTLGKLDDIVGTTTHAQVAIVFDYENRWAIDDALGPRNIGKDYPETCVDHYRPFWSAGIDVDVIAADAPFDGYSLVIAPMLYMIKPGVAEAIERFVSAGGTFVTTYMSGIADESDLCFQNGFPGPLRRLAGVWAEEIDAIYDEERVKVVASENNHSGLSGTYEACAYCDLLHADTARVLAAYGSEFYAGRPAVTVNTVGKGKFYYIGSRNDVRFHADFTHHLIAALALRRPFPGDLPDGVMAVKRTDGSREYVFLLNFTNQDHPIHIGEVSRRDFLTGKALRGNIDLKAYSFRIIAAAGSS